MDFLPMNRLTKCQISVDGKTVGEFYHTKNMSLRERDEMATEFAAFNFISSRGVRVYPVTNDGKINGKFVMPHYGKIK